MGWVEFSFQALVVLASFLLPALWFSYHYESSLLSVVLTVTLSSVRVAASHEVQIRDHNGQTGPEPLHNFTGCKIGHSLPEGARSVAVASPGRAYSLLEIMGSAPLPWPWLSQVCCTFQDKILIYVKCLSKLQTSGTCRELACALPCPPMYPLFTQCPCHSEGRMVTRASEGRGLALSLFPVFLLLM